MPRKKVEVIKKGRPRKVRAEEGVIAVRTAPVKDTHLAEARAYLTDLETLYALLMKYNISRLGTVVELMNRQRAKVVGLEKLN